MIEPNRMYTPEEAATELQVSTRTMYEWIRLNIVRGTKFGPRCVRVRGAHMLDPQGAQSFSGKTIFDSDSAMDFRLNAIEYQVGKKLDHLPNQSIPWNQ